MCAVLIILVTVTFVASGREFIRHTLATFDAKLAETTQISTLIVPAAACTNLAPSVV